MYLQHFHSYLAKRAIRSALFKRLSITTLTSQKEETSCSKKTMRKIYRKGKTCLSESTKRSIGNYHWHDLCVCLQSSPADRNDSYQYPILTWDCFEDCPNPKKPVTTLAPNPPLQSTKPHLFLILHSNSGPSPTTPHELVMQVHGHGGIKK